MSEAILNPKLAFWPLTRRAGVSRTAFEHAIDAGRGSTRLLFSIAAAFSIFAIYKLPEISDPAMGRSLIADNALALALLSSIVGLVSQWTEARAAESYSTLAIGGIGGGLLMLVVTCSGADTSLYSYFLAFFILSTLALGSLRPARVLPVMLGLLAVDVASAYLRIGWDAPAHLTLLIDGTATVIGTATCLRVQRLHQHEWLRARQALEDPLTGLGNRRAFERDGEQALALARRERRPVTLALIDVDRFKRVNDQNGHAAGDTALRSIADSLSHLARRPMDCAARLGGDEFAVLWYDMDDHQARQRCQMLVDEIAGKTLEVGDSEIPHPTISLGAVTIIPDRSLDLTELQRRADAALYEAKDARGNQANVITMVPVPRTRDRAFWRRRGAR